MKYLLFFASMLLALGANGAGVQQNSATTNLVPLILPSSILTNGSSPGQTLQNVGGVTAWAAGGGGGGNTYIVTNNAYGTVTAFVGGFTNGTIGAANAVAKIWPVYGGSPVDTSDNGSVTVPLQPGTYTNFQVLITSAPGTATNVFYILTNGISTGLVVTNNGTSIGSFTALSQAQVSLQITNWGASAITGVSAYWSLGMQVPTSVVGINATNVLDATLATNSLQFGGVPPSGYVTNYPGILMFPYKVFWLGAGYANPPHWTNFPNSTTAGLQELQEMFPYTTNHPGLGNGIVVAMPADEICPGDGSFTNWVNMTNAMSIVGLGGLPMTTVLEYSGPGFSPNQITNPLPIFAGDNGEGAGGAVLWCNTNTVNVSAFSWNVAFNDYHFNNFTLRLNTTNACVGIGGLAMDASIENVAFVGPHYMKVQPFPGFIPLNYDTEYQLLANQIPYPPNLIAVSLNVAQTFYIGGPFTFINDEYTCGFESYGNCQLEWDHEPYVSEVGWYTNGVGSAFAPQSLYSLGIGYLVDGGETYQADINYCASYQNNIDVAVMGDSQDVNIENCGQQKSNFHVALDNVNGASVSQLTGDGQNPDAYLITNNPSGAWLVDANLSDPIYSQFNNENANAAQGWVAINSAGVTMGTGNAIQAGVNHVGFFGNALALTNYQGFHVVGPVAQATTASNLAPISLIYTLKSGVLFYTNSLTPGTPLPVITGVFLDCVTNDAASGYTTNSVLDANSVLNASDFLNQTAFFGYYIDRGTNVVLNLSAVPQTAGLWSLLYASNNNIGAPTSMFNFKFQINVIP